MATKDQLNAAITAEKQQAAARRKADQDAIAALTAEVAALKAETVALKAGGIITAADADGFVAAVQGIEPDSTEPP